MASNMNLDIAKAIVNGPPRENGENNHPQFNFEGGTKPSEKGDILQELKNKLVGLNDFLVRGVDSKKIDSMFDEIIGLINKFPDDSEDKVNMTVKLLLLTAYQRDIDDGKGERDIFYFMVFNLWQKLQSVTEVLLRSILPTSHACWGDVRNMLFILKKLEEKQLHWVDSLTVFLSNLFVEHLRVDMNAMINGELPTLACKWAPRQQGKFDWLAKRFSRALFPEIMEIGSRMKAYRK